jgi:hypothetical protein
VHSASSWRELRNSLCSPPWSVWNPSQMLVVCNQEHQTQEFAEAEFHVYVLRKHEMTYNIRSNSSMFINFCCIAVTQHVNQMLKCLNDLWQI